MLSTALKLQTVSLGLRKKAIVYYAKIPTAWFQINVKKETSIFVRIIKLVKKILNKPPF